MCIYKGRQEKGILEGEGSANTPLSFLLFFFPRVATTRNSLKNPVPYAAATGGIGKTVARFVPFTS